MKPSHVAVVGALHAKETPDRMVGWTPSMLLQALMRRDARIWAKRTDRSENAAMAPDPTDADAKIEAAKSRGEEKRAAKKRAERLAAGLPVRGPR